MHLNLNICSGCAGFKYNQFVDFLEERGYMYCPPYSKRGTETNNVRVAELTKPPPEWCDHKLEHAVSDALTENNYEKEKIK